VSASDYKKALDRGPAVQPATKRRCSQPGCTGLVVYEGLFTAECDNRDCVAHTKDPEHQLCSIDMACTELFMY
jgi:hypothetical protein